MEEKYEVRVKGMRPLLQHRMSNEPAQRKKSGAARDNMEDAKNVLYLNEQGQVCQPARHFECAMIKAASNYKIPGQGKKTFKDAFKAGIFVDPLLIVHKNQEWKMDLANVVVQRARILRARPRLDTWELEFTIINIDERVTEDVIKDVLTDAGKFCGIGDDRPRYGTFEITHFKKIK